MLDGEDNENWTDGSYDNEVDVVVAVEDGRRGIPEGRCGNDCVDAGTARVASHTGDKFVSWGSVNASGEESEDKVTFQHC